MMHTFPELVIGGVLVAPFVTYAVAGAILFAALRPILRLVGVERLFANPPLALIGLYVVIVAVLIVLF